MTNCKCNCGEVKGVTVSGPTISGISNSLFIGDSWKPVMTDDRLIKDPKYSGCFEIIENNVAKTVHIKRVLFNDPVVVVWWSDGTTTRSKVRGDDKYSPEAGLIYCIFKKIAPKTTIDTLLDEWMPSQIPMEYKMQYVDIKDVKAQHKNK